MTPLDLLWLFFILSSLQPLLQQRYLASQRTYALRALQKQRGSRVVTLIHRREGLSILGIPFGAYIDIEDSEALIRVIEMTDKETPIDLILHTPGGLVLAAEQIATALAEHPSPVTVFVPHYAMSGGTLIAMAADQIVLAPSAVLGPVDPQLGEYPAASIIATVERKDVNELDDKTLILSDIARKAQVQVHDFVSELLAKQLATEHASELAKMLSDGRWTHDFPIDAKRAQSIGLKVTTDMPDLVRKLMRLYPQPRGRRPSVEYLPGRYAAPERGRRRVLGEKS
jgi:ClpP class serine protease